MASSSPVATNLATSRYTDLSGEPIDRLLVPIKGYQEKPLVSLEEATKPISHLFQNLEENIWIAKQNCRNPLNDLTQDESAAIHLYTMQFDSGESLYKIMNETLRNADRETLRPWFSFLKLLITGFWKLPSRSQIVWRGIRGVNMSDRYKTGMKFAWWGVNSCTVDVETLKSPQFLGQTGLRTLFSIECINGKSIDSHSYFKSSEKEVILLPGSYFEVIGQLNPAPGFHLIQLREITPPFPFLKPPFLVAGKQSSCIADTPMGGSPPSAQTSRKTTLEELEATVEASSKIRQIFYFQFILSKLLTIFFLFI